MVAVVVMTISHVYLTITSIHAWLMHLAILTQVGVTVRQYPANTIHHYCYTIHCIYVAKYHCTVSSDPYSRRAQSTNEGGYVPLLVELLIVQRTCCILHYTTSMYLMGTMLQ